MKSKSTVIILVLAGVVIIGAFLLSANSNNGGIVVDDEGPGPLDDFAQCIKDSGTTYYGAFWCPSCKKQNEIFGPSKRLLPYVECSLPSRKGQYPICDEKKIQSYPTWDFPDGERLVGVLELEALSKKTGCSLPAELQ